MDVEEYKQLCANTISAVLEIEFQKIVHNLMEQFPMLEGIVVPKFLIYLKEMRQ